MIYRNLLKATRHLQFCAVVLSLLAGAAQAGLQRAELPMQFSSGGHVLGFTPEGVLVAGRDHLLKVNFVGAAAVAPKATADSERESVTAPSAATTNTNTNGQGAAPLKEVHYRNLWPGIDLRYDAKAGIVRSTYTLAPGAKVAAIRLAYNVPFALGNDGALALTFATGTLTETAPIAWQEIKGKHQPVQVAFHKHDNGELGFTLGDYDPVHPLTIDPTLIWNTFLGGAGDDRGFGIATDAAGNVY